MRTTVYIDGYNLYYGALRGTPYKWLDVVHLFETICHAQNSATQIQEVKFFTAPIKARISTRKDQALRSQRLYLNALKQIYPDRMTVVEGFFQLTKGMFPRYQDPLDKTDKVAVWLLEEKRTDVNIALHLYDDVVQGKVEQVVLISNDSDLVPALQFARRAAASLVIGTILPRRYHKAGNQRPNNIELSSLSNWSRQYIRDEELQAAQLPNKIPTLKKPIFKPDYW